MASQNARYSLLGLDPSLEPGPDDIRKAYYATALRLHPDKNPDDD